MSTNQTEKLKYPIGKLQFPDEITREMVNLWIKEIEGLPLKLKKAVSELSEAEMQTPYRPEGWTALQVVHHLADSHINGFMRFKLALTEYKPTIKPYYEDRWAELPDSHLTPVEVSLALLEALHQRWTVLLMALTDEDLKKTVIHPEHGKEISVEELIATYAWHGNHHLEHVKLVKRP
ncbi:putative metal-dependent hydrolase [Limibacter armeniacum]|uniref:YfiT family bacillithiol transferase n=1 Tax=Limibacter armeniacum TaxID=466084 RepID=UPI002FE50E05